MLSVASLWLAREGADGICCLNRSVSGVDYRLRILQLVKISKLVSQWSLKWCYPPLCSQIRKSVHRDPETRRKETAALHLPSLISCSTVQELHSPIVP
jgi:hypothetical protein